MKLAVTALGTDMNAAIDPRFGRCQNFVIIDSDTGQHEAFSNEGIASSGGAGTQSAQFLASHKVDAVVTGNLGPNAVRALDAAGIKAYRMESGRVSDALEAFKAGKLSMISGATVGSHHGMGSR